MPCDADFTNQCELLQSGLAVVSELERTENEDSPRLEQARSYLSRAGQKVRTDGFSQPFAKAIGLATSVAVSHGHDDVAQDALQLSDSWIEYSTIKKQEENLSRACKLVVDELFIDTSCPDEFVRRTESILEELNCEVRSDFDELGRLFFVDVADPDCIGTVEIVLDELEWYSNFCYRESEDDTEEYAVSYVGEFTQDTTPTTEGGNV